MGSLLAFARPHNGWLPIELTVGERFFEFEASRIPQNPVVELVDAAHRAAVGLPSAVWFQLEPGELQLAFEPDGDHVTVRVTCRPERTVAGTELALASLTRDQALLPVWRCVKSFAQQTHPAQDWDDIDMNALAALRRAIGQPGGERAHRLA